MLRTLQALTVIGQSGGYLDQRTLQLLIGARQLQCKQFGAELGEQPAVLGSMVSLAAS